MKRRMTAGIATLLLLTSGCASAGPTATDKTAPSERATPGGLAAVVLEHLDDHRASDLAGGLTDMEDQRYVAVSFVLDGGDNLLEVQASDPDYLPGDRGPDECDREGTESRPNGARHECQVLDDGTIVEVYLLPAGKQTGGRSLALGFVEGPDRSVKVEFESGAEQPELTWDELHAIALDPLLAWTTSSEANADGESLDVAVEDRVDR